MLASHAVDIAVIISTLIDSLCFTFAEPFDDIFLFVVHGSAEIQTKVYDPRKEGWRDRPIDQAVNSRSLTKLLFRILQNSREKVWNMQMRLLMTSYAQPNFIQSMSIGYVGQFALNLIG